MSAPIAKRGFALPAVLAIVAILTLVFLVAMLALDDLGAQARRASAQARFETAAASLEAHAAFAAATGRPAPRGFVSPSPDGRGETLVIADGRAYAAAGAPDLRISLQDAAGQINLNALPASAMPRLFERLRVSADARIAMADRLADFVDVDGLVRAQGAEASAYAQRGLAPPPNALLGRSEQVLGVLGWRDVVPRSAWNALRDDLTADPPGGETNVNTATPETLRVLYGLDEARTAAAIATREQAPFGSLEAFGRAVGVRLSGDAERVYGFPNGRFLVKITSASTGSTYRSRVLLTPRDPERPLRIEAPVLSSSTGEAARDARTDAPFFPDPAPGLADPGRPVRTR